jgi:cytochrome b6-f complex iron-sulfur subunit
MDNHEEASAGRAIGRRDWLSLAGRGIGGGCLLGAGLLGFRFVAPPRIRDLSQEIDLGRPGRIPVGAIHHLAAEHLFVIHEAGGYYALSGRCSHLGCRVLPLPDGFSCPCHGGRFDLRGRPVAGPPPRPLDWLELGLGGEGQLVLHPRRAVAFGALFRPQAR